jgi:hypothetical protein
MDLIDQRIEMILKHGKPMSPHPRMNLELYVKRANLAYQRAEINQAPVDRLDMLGKTIDMAISLQEKAAKELAAKLAAAQGAAPPPANGAMAAPPPVQAA